MPESVLSLIDAVTNNRLGFLADAALGYITKNNSRLVLLFSNSQDLLQLDDYLVNDSFGYIFMTRQSY